METTMKIRHMGRNVIALLGTLLIAGLVTAAPASAQDYGGDGNPAVDCPNGYTVASANIVENGTVIGLVEMRWSWACSGNWTRTTSYIGARNLYSEIYASPSDSRSASATN